MVRPIITLSPWEIVVTTMVFFSMWLIKYKKIKIQFQPLKALIFLGFSRLEI